MSRHDEGRNEAKAQVEHILALMSAYETNFDLLDELQERDDLDADELAELNELLEQAGGYANQDEVREGINSNQYGVEVRSSWTTLGRDLELDEFKITLCGGGPACWIQGTLNMGEPDSVRVYYNDWGVPATEYNPGSEVLEAVLAYAQAFHYGE